MQMPVAKCRALLKPWWGYNAERSFQLDYCLETGVKYFVDVCLRFHRIVLNRRAVFHGHRFLELFNLVTSGHEILNSGFQNNTI